MKTIIITLLATFIFSIGNTFAKDESNIYKNVEKDITGKIEKTTIYEGENGTNLKPIKQIIAIYDDDGNVNERTMYTWDSMNEKWQSHKKYTYQCDGEGQHMCTSYKAWDDKTNNWKTIK